MVLMSMFREISNSQHSFVKPVLRSSSCKLSCTHSQILLAAYSIHPQPFDWSWWTTIKI